MVHSFLHIWLFLVAYALLIDKILATILQGWEFCYFVASRNIFDGFCDATHIERTKKLGSDNLIDKLHYSLGFFYLPWIAYFSMCPSFVGFKRSIWLE